MIKRPVPELLSPAGDLDKLKAAVAYGADAVYAGGRQYGLRQASRNFSHEELKEACGYVHARGKRLFLTLNATPYSRELDNVAAFIRTAAEAGVDAFIIADLGVMALAKKYAPDVPIHMSTQTGVVNRETARQLVEMGAKRLVLARELSLEDIADIKATLPKGAEVEVFVHGAMCVSYSGRCLLSNYMAGRDSNQGACAQPCRWKYTLMEEKRPGEYFPVFEDGGTYLLNSKDLCLIEHLDKLREAGVDSLKIEGRVKTEFYVATITGAYRRALDDLSAGRPFERELLKEVCKVSHREYYTGFLFGDQTDGQIYDDNTYIRDYEISAVIEGARDGQLLCRTKNPFSVGDRAEILSPEGVVSLTITGITSPEGEPMDRACHPEQVVSVPFEGTVKRPAFLRRPAE